MDIRSNCTPSCSLEKLLYMYTWRHFLKNKNCSTGSMPRKRLPARAFPGAVLPSRGRWICCAGFPWGFGLPSTAAAQGNVYTTPVCQK